MAVKITRAILEERTRGPITTTRQLSRIVARVKGDREKIDPATRVFQALRIEVNEELQSLSRFLAAAVGKLNAGGRLAVLSYHLSADEAAHGEGARPASANGAGESGNGRAGGAGAHAIPKVASSGRSF